MFELEFSSHSVQDSIQEVAPFKEISINSLESKSISFEILNVSDVSLLKRMISDVRMEVAEKDDLNHQDPFMDVLLNQSDLIKGFYEGGFKTWECSLDLVQFLSTCEPDFFHQKTMIDLGCGSGLPGIYALQRGACVDFSDYNEQVLEMVTIPNVLLNVFYTESALNAKESEYDVDLDYSKLREIPSKFFSGDWKNIYDAIEPERYDVILTSETIYDSGSFMKLYNLLKKSIKPSGCVYVAAKACYFGCSGSLISFIDFIKNKGPCQVQTIYCSNLSVKREIVCIQFE